MYRVLLKIDRVSIRIK
jgi:hypothetical protein